MCNGNDITYCQQTELRRIINIIYKCTLSSQLIIVIKLCSVLEEEKEEEEVGDKDKDDKNCGGGGVG